MTLNQPQCAPYGTWQSPIKTELLASDTISLQQTEVDEASGNIYYLEGRPTENGRCCIVEYSHDGHAKDVLPSQFSAMTKVYEYGGAPFALGTDHTIIFSDGNTMGVFSLGVDSGEVKPVIEANPLLRYADFNVHPVNPRWVVAVKEDHSSSTVENYLIAIDKISGTSVTIAQGADFYSYPRFNKEGTKVCWIQWNHPEMPWTSTTLYVADWLDGKVGTAKAIAGTSTRESILQPCWGSDGTLFFVSDTTGFWQIYQMQKDAQEPSILRMPDLECFDFSIPAWMLGTCTYIPLSGDKLVAAYIRGAASRLILIDLTTGSYKDLEIPIIDLNFNGIRRVSDNSFTVIGSTETTPKALYLINIEPSSQMKVLKSSTDVIIPSSFVSTAEHISAPRLDVGEDKTYALYNPPNNPNYVAPKGTLPPAIMLMHGGPTAQSTPGLSLVIQYWTTRGYAVVQVNYIGSSGYGRAYRDFLNGKWGISDVEDAVSVAGYLVSKGYIDADRIGIVGGSSGGYAALQALCKFPEVWAGGISLYGISGLEILYKTTHKFEAHYMDYLLFRGTKNINDKEKEALFHDRSPCYHADKIKAPTLLLQGSDDKVVPPSQALDMEKSIKENGGVVRLVMFDGEGHGFRKAPNVLKAKEEEEAWWTKTLVRSATPDVGSR